MRGVEGLAPGAYPLFRSVHPFMRGELRVVDPPAVSIRVAGVSSPTAIEVRGDTLYAVSRDEGTVTAFPIEEGGLLGQGTVHAAGFEGPRGIAVAPDGTLFVSDSHPSERPGRERDGRVWAVPPDGGDVGEVGEVVLDELPNGVNATNDLAVHAGRLHVTNGSSTDDGVAGPPDEATSGTLLSLPTTARGLTPADLESDPQPGDPPPGLLIEASGMRNPADVAFRPGRGEAWVPSVGPTGLAPLGHDLLLRTHVAAVAPDFGFPACLHDEEGNAAQNPRVEDVCDGSQDRPELSLGLGVVPGGASFGPGGPFWRGDLFVALTGTPGAEAGHAVVRVPVDAVGAASDPEVLVDGGDPSDVAFSPDGLYVADLRAGTILLVRPAV